MYPCGFLASSKARAYRSVRDVHHDAYGLQSAALRLAIITPIVLLVIFLLLHSSFHSARLALLIFLAVPMAASGGVYALALRGMPFSISAGVGFIALFGVAVLNGLVWVSAAENLRRSGMEIHEATHETADKRLRPVLMTAMVAALERLAAAGLTLAVISNDNAAGIRHFLASLGLAQLFHSQLWSADDHPCKPHPDAVHGLCRRLGTEARHCALIGDANSDLHMARQAGVAAVIGYRSGWSLVPSLDPRYPQLNHWDELSVALATGGTDHR